LELVVYYQSNQSNQFTIIPTSLLSFQPVDYQSNQLTIIPTSSNQFIYWCNQFDQSNQSNQFTIGPTS